MQKHSCCFFLVLLQEIERAANKKRVCHKVSPLQFLGTDYTDYTDYTDFLREMIIALLILAL